MEKIDGWIKIIENSPELKCNHCGVVFKGQHECDYEKLKIKVQQLENINRELSGSLEWHIEANERYEETLKKINNICETYNSKGWALNPDKIQKLVLDTLKD